MDANNADRLAPPPKKKKTGSTKAPTGTHCIAPGCTQFYYKSPGKHFHRLPVNKPQLLRQWLQRLKRQDPPESKYARVCSDHFLDTDYKTKGIITNDGGFCFEKTNILKENAVPTVFDFSMYEKSTDAPTTASKATSASSTARRKRREARQWEKEKQQVWLDPHIALFIE